MVLDQPDHYPKRSDVARAVCVALDWVRPNGMLATGSCRAALAHMQRDGLIVLPAPVHPGPSTFRGPRRLPTPPRRDWPAAIACDLGELSPIRLVAIASRGSQAAYYRDILTRFHYLGYAPIRGAQIRYAIESGRGPVGVIAFGSAAWRVTVRDRFIGWDDATRARNLGLIVQNVRFLIPPWVRVDNLASHVLSLAARQLPGDWLTRYGTNPLLLETFVDSYQFSGTCYRAANWRHLGQTAGKGRNNRRTRLRRHLPEKDVYVYPLDPNFRHHILT